MIKMVADISGQCIAITDKGEFVSITGRNYIDVPNSIGTCNEVERVVSQLRIMFRNTRYKIFKIDGEILWD